MMALVRRVVQRAGLMLTGALTQETRHNVRTELLSSIVFGPFYAALLFIPVVLERLGASPGMVAIYQSQTYIGLFLAAFSVLVIPRGNVLLFLAISWTIGRGAFLLTGFAPGAVGLLGLAAIFWFSDGFPGAAYTEVIRRVYPADVRGRALSVVRLGMVIAMLVSTPLVGIVLDRFGPQVLFPIVAVLGVVSAWMFTRMRLGNAGDLDARPVRQANAKQSVADLWRVIRSDRRFAVYLLAIVFFGLGGLLGIAFYPAVLVDRLKLSYESVSWLSFAQSLTWIAGLVVWGRLVDRLGGPWVMRLCFALSVLVPLSYIWANSAWLLLPAYLVQGLTSGGIDLAFTNTVIDLAEPGRVYEYAALQRTVIGIRGLLGPFLGVWLFNLGVPVAIVFVLGALFFVLAALCISRREFSKPQPQRAREAPAMSR
jgi:predicted MFS family arabinose efflux permease